MTYCYLFICCGDGYHGEGVEVSGQLVESWVSQDTMSGNQESNSDRQA